MVRVVYLLWVGSVAAWGGRVARSSVQENLRSGSHLSSLALEATNALLSPLGSHRERLDWR